MLKNTLFLSATLGLALFAPACGGDKDGGTGDTGDTTGGTTTDTDTTPVVTGIDSFGVGCTGDDVTFDVQATLNGTEAIVDAADTASGGAGNYYEAHVLPPTNTGDNYTEFSLTIPSTGSYSQSASTLFSCAADTHFEEDPKGKIMTYVVRAYDAQGLADCFAVGHDAPGMIGGAYNDFGNTVSPGDISAANCEEGAWTR
jgi:hypothetical protein